LPRGGQANKHARVLRTLPSLRTALAALCVVLAAVFAAASATSVIDHLQHETRIAHDHEAFLAHASTDDRHAGALDDHPEHEADQDDATPADHSPAAGHHHHADSPVGALGATALIELARFAGAERLPRLQGQAPKGVNPGGLERPPRSFATPV